MTDPFDDDLRAMLRAAAPDDTHVDDGWADLTGRLDGAVTPTLDPRPPRRARALLVAAVAVVAVGLVALVVARGDEPERTISGPGPTTSTTTTAVPVEAGTGWWIPVGLDGWELETVGSDFKDIEPPASEGACPCTSETWVGESGTFRRIAASSAVVGGDPEPDDLEDLRDAGLVPAEVAPGIDGYLGAESATSYARWDLDGVRTYVSGSNLAQEEFVDAVEHLATGADGPPFADAISLGPREIGDLRSFQDVHVTLRNVESGRRVAYVLSPPPFALDLTAFLATRQIEDAQAGPNELRTIRGEGLGPGDRVWTIIDSGVWIDETAGFGAADGTEDDVVAVLGALVPATADEWSAFLATATGEVDEDPPLDVASIDDLTQPAD